VVEEPEGVDAVNPSIRHGWLAAGVVLTLALSFVGAANARAQEVSRPADGQRVVLVTGSTSGLGRERGMEVVSEIEAGGGSARFLEADFGSFAEVRELAHAILAAYGRLDVLVNNAGLGSAPDERLLSEDGHELRFQVNYLAHFLLTDLLLPLLEESAPSRIVNVSSLAQAPIDFDDVMIENGFSGGRAYAQSKLAQVMHTIDLHEELGERGILVNSLHPATFMPTGMVRRLGVEPRATIDEGADAVMHLIEADGLEGGQFFNQMNPGRANAQAYDPEARALLRTLSRELTGTG
jgi:NAD(P)-dependent dehydrogenase (short-subunit alcohol dehydrogenase family)